jgi:hypothetical protein
LTPDRFATIFIISLSKVGTSEIIDIDFALDIFSSDRIMTQKLFKD